MEITEEQRRRAEANRLAALEKRRRLDAGMAPDAWRLSKCRKIPGVEAGMVLVEKSGLPPLPPPQLPPSQPSGFRIGLEICSPEEFSVTPEPLQGLLFPGVIECFRSIEACLSSVVPFRFVESQGGRRGVYMLRDYELVLRSLKKLAGVKLEDIPYSTRCVVQKFSHCAGNQWVPCLDQHYSDEKVNDLMLSLPKLLRDALLPYQLEGVRFGLRRGGRCLIADEMGLGKTIQAIAIACCFIKKGPLLVVCPAVLRYSWAEELERWLPFLQPKDIHLVFGHRNNLDRLERNPKVVVISYAMLKRLRESMLGRRWEVMVVDESHKLRCTKKKSESEETKAVLDVAKVVRHIILLSGTPSLSRPYDIYHQVNMLWPRLLGKDKYEFAKSYCSMKLYRGCQGMMYQDFSKGIRLEELNVLLRQSLMIRRLKEHVLTQLPPKRRQLIMLKIKASDILSATTLSGMHGRNVDGEHKNEYVEKDCSPEVNGDKDENFDRSGTSNDGNQKNALKKLSNQEIGLAKLSGFREWFSNHAIIMELEDIASFDIGLGSKRMIIFAHHLKVLDGVQRFVCEKGIKFVRIDGSTLPRDRQSAVEDFRSSKEVKVAIVGITAGGVGLDFSSAQNVVFLELPKSASEMLQAEDRAHRRGQVNAVNIYIFCAKETSDEPHWLQLNKSLFRVSSMVNGKIDAIQEIEVERFFQLDSSGNSSCDWFQEARWRSRDINMLAQTAEVGAGAATDQSEVDKDDVCDANLGECSAKSGDKRDGHRLTKEARQLNSVSRCTLEKDNEEYIRFKELTCEGKQDDRINAIWSDDANGGASELVETDLDRSFQAESLRFEVSENTGRVHLYVCTAGKDSRPQLLGENFRVEELESMILTAGEKNEKAALQAFKENPSCYIIFQAFIKEWSELRPFEQKKLRGKPLQLPLNLELCYLKEAINHESRGLLKGGSKKRVTPLSEISHPLPENAVWKKVHLYGGAAKEKEYTQACNVGGEPLCKLCQAPCSGRLAEVPEYFEDLFCNLSCFEEYRIRTSQRALRGALFHIEHGICTNCKLDCHKLVASIRPLTIPQRQQYIEKVAPKLAEKQKLLRKLVHEPTEGNAWHADHLVPVYKGGGECRLENMRTLCVACHSEVTKAQQAELRSIRVRAKRRLKISMAKLRSGTNADPSNSSAQVKTSQEVGQVPAEDDDLLFVAVPGSAYSVKENLLLQDQEQESRS